MLKQVTPPILILMFTLLLTACAGQPTRAAEGDALAAERDGPSIFADDGYPLPLRRWGPDAPTIVVLALHGFNDYGGSMETLALRLATADVAVYAYDQRGFGVNPRPGIWAGHARMAADAAQAADHLRERYPDTPLYLAGKSMGGAVATMAQVLHAPPVDGTVLIAPAIWGRDFMPWYQRSVLWLGRWLLPGVSFSADLAQRFVEIHPTDDPEVMAQLRSDPLVQKRARSDTLAGLTTLMDEALAALDALPGPALILYGGNDDLVPKQAACAMLDRLAGNDNDWRMAYYPEGYHMLTRQLDATTVIDDIAVWLTDPGAPLPSNREVDHARAMAAICDGDTIGTDASP